MSDFAYFLNHSIGQYPGKAADMTAATAEFARIWGAGDDSQWPQVLAARSAFISLWQDLIDAPAGTLTTTESVTAGLYTVLGALPPEMLTGRRVLVSADCFPSLHFLLAGLAQRRGFTLETVPLRAGENWVREDDLMSRLGPDVALTLVTLVTSTAGYRADLDILLPAIHGCGSLVVLDLTQGIGVVPVSLTTLSADIVISTSLKWLCGAPGAGILQVATDLLQACAPELRGWFSQPDPFSWDLEGFQYADDARRFDAGTPAPLAAVASLPGLRWQAGQGCAVLLNHAQGLGDVILDGSRALGLTAATPPERARRGGSVMLRLPSDCDPRAVVAGLRAANVYADARGAVLRLSPGATTTTSDVNRLMSSLRDLL
ncbi:aminotransferase class V-fold PLP-dependent enzyme [Loktanella sp. DJP18]|uniref:aminotransferase class V-fold PLP-dependent enzyme n=1 Tax=Loktanella sp. DJP18 TaxID=3409788 RepID=UPI003BB6A915